MTNQKEFLLEALQSLLEEGSVKLDIDAFELLSKEVWEKLKELRTKIVNYLGDSPELVYQRYELIKQYFPEIAEELKQKSQILLFAFLIQQCEIKVYAGGVFTIKTKNGKFYYQRKLSDISKFIQSLQESQADPKKKIKLLFTTEELYHLLTSSNISLNDFNTVKMNLMISDLVMRKIPEALPFKNEEQEIAFHYFIVSLKSKIEEEQDIYDWKDRDYVLNELDCDPEFTIFYDKEKRVLYIPTKFIKLIIERNPRLILTVFKTLNIKDLRIWYTSYVKDKGIMGESKIDVRYYLIKIDSLNKILEKLGYERIEIKTPTREQLIKLKEERDRKFEESLHKIEIPDDLVDNKKSNEEYLEM